MTWNILSRCPIAQLFDSLTGKNEMENWIANQSLVGLGLNWKKFLTYAIGKNQIELDEVKHDRHQSDRSHAII